MNIIKDIVYSILWVPLFVLYAIGFCVLAVTVVINMTLSSIFNRQSENKKTGEPKKRDNLVDRAETVALNIEKIINDMASRIGKEV